ncbi:MAG TPA: hypothetical protein VFS08_11105 [Gemmatimonadaceae bacterium]|nr:hypothetical protein [Gemmatimonadaceae bacterium]
MWTACLFCHGHLGRNDLLPTFRVGRRLAFDPARGRLWVLCSRCGRWNLSPLEERWEAIEDAERLFRGTPVRVSTDHVGMAELPEGLTLVRIGAAPKPELATWRYGRLLRRHLVRTAAGRAVARGASELSRVVSRGVRSAVRSVGLPMPGYDALTWLRIHVLPDRVLAMAPTVAGTPLVIRAAHLEHAALIRPERREPWRIVVPHDGGIVTLTGDAGLRTAGKLFAALNGVGASGEQVQAAFRKLEDAGNPDGYFARIAALALRTSWGRFPDAVADGPLLPTHLSDAERLALYLTNRSFWARGAIGSEPRTTLPKLPLVDRLALEMAANEDAERRAMEGELAALEAAWREAEEIAAIADALPHARAPRLVAPHPAPRIA